LALKELAGGGGEFSILFYGSNGTYKHVTSCL